MTMMKGLLAAAMICGASAGADAAITYEVQNGKLTAIRGVGGTPLSSSDINLYSPQTYVANGVTYETTTDIEFADGTCAQVFGKCSELNSLGFFSRRIPQFLMPLLVDGVVVDGKTYNLNSDPTLVNGCSDATVCNIYAGIYDPNFTEVRARIIANYASGRDLDVLADESPEEAAVDTGTLANATYARFNTVTRQFSVAAVPEPATWALMLLGFGMVAGASRYRRRATGLRYN